MKKRDAIKLQPGDVVSLWRQMRKGDVAQEQTGIGTVLHVTRNGGVRVCGILPATETNLMNYGNYTPSSTDSRWFSYNTVEKEALPRKDVLKIPGFKGPAPGRAPVSRRHSASGSEDK